MSVLGTLGVVGATVGAAGSLGAASIQSGAALTAEQQQAQQQAQALNFQKEQWNTQQQNLAPWLKAGGSAEAQLSDLMQNGGFPSWDKTFQAPTAEEARQTPGYQFAMDQGQQAVQNSAAARGGLLSGNAVTAAQKYGQGLADTNYQQVYNNALQQYQQGYNQFQNNQANQFNRLSTLAGTGQVAANTLGQEGQSVAGNVSTLALTGGAQQAQQINNAAAATASGYSGATNAFTGGINNISQLMMMQNMGLFKPPVAATGAV